MKSPFFGEFMGTMMMILLGDGVVAGVLLKRSKAENSGWIVITAGWCFAVMAGIYTAIACGSSDAHLNPAITLGAAIVSGDYSKLMSYVPAQMLGAFLNDEPSPFLTTGTGVREGKLAFVFSGNGAQFAGMGRDALHSNAAYRDAIEDLDRMLRPDLGWSVICRMPEPWAREAFRAAADIAWRRQGPRVQVLEGNLRRVLGSDATGAQLRALSREAMRSYARYWLEVFRLPVMPIARLVDPHVDMILVGDSLGMVIYGMTSTLAVTLDMMLAHGKAAVRASAM